MLTKNTAFQQDQDSVDSSPKVDQNQQTSDFEKPDLNLSAYLEHEENNKSVSIALQVGESIRESQNAENQLSFGEVHQKLEHFSKNFNQKTKIEVKAHERESEVYDEGDEDESS